MFKLECLVPENIHAPPTEWIGPKIYSNVRSVNWNFPGGDGVVIEQIPSMGGGGEWIFSATTQF